MNELRTRSVVTRPCARVAPVLAVLLAAACKVTDEYPSSGTLFPALPASPVPGSPKPETQDAGSVMYGRDGKPVGAPSNPNPGGVELGSAASPSLLPGENGRMHILELYQKVIEERDALVMEVSELLRQVEQGRLDLAAEKRRATELESKLAVLEADRARTLDENLELAGRLTTAQIRRLQAEKLLLEHKLQTLPVDTLEVAVPAAATNKP